MGAASESLRTFRVTYQSCLDALTRGDSKDAFYCTCRHTSNQALHRTETSGRIAQLPFYCIEGKKSNGSFSSGSNHKRCTTGINGGNPQCSINGVDNL